MVIIHWCFYCFYSCGCFLERVLWVVINRPVFFHFLFWLLLPYPYLIIHILILISEYLLVHCTLDSLFSKSILLLSLNVRKKLLGCPFSHHNYHQSFHLYLLFHPLHHYYYYLFLTFLYVFDFHFLSLELIIW